MEKLNDTTRELAEISKDLSGIDFDEIINKACQIKAVINMAEAYIENIGNVPCEREIIDEYLAMLSIIDTLQDKIFVLDDRIVSASRRLASIV